MMLFVWGFFYCFHILLDKSWPRPQSSFTLTLRFHITLISKRSSDMALLKVLLRYTFAFNRSSFFSLSLYASCSLKHIRNQLFSPAMLKAAGTTCLMIWQARKKKIKNENILKWIILITLLPFVEQSIRVHACSHLLCSSSSLFLLALKGCP